MKAIDQAASDIVRWRSDYVACAHEALNVGQLDPWQAEVLTAYPTERFIAIPACHGPGKTFTMAVAAWCNFICLFPLKQLGASASRAHLNDNLWSELATVWAMMAPEIAGRFYMTENHIYLLERPDMSFMTARAANKQNPNVLAGLHAANVATFFDEAQGIHDAVYETAEGSDSAAAMRMMLCGNPTELTGKFFRACNDPTERAEWWVRPVAWHDSSRVSEAYVDRLSRIYGADSNTFRIRALGQFPTADSRSIIPLDVVEEAMNRTVVPDNGDVIWGLDVGSKGKCPSVLAAKEGNRILPPVRWDKLTSEQLVEKVAEIYRGRPPHLRPIRVNVDGVGVGDGVPDMLIARGVPALHINGGIPAPWRPDRALLARDAMMFNLDRWIRRPTNALPGPAGDEKLLEMKLQIAQPRLIEDSFRGRARAERKSELAARGIGSPDVLDAISLTQAEDWMIPKSRAGDLGMVEGIYAETFGRGAPAGRRRAIAGAAVAAAILTAVALWWAFG